MEQKPMFVVSGGIKLPIGYRFHPTDEELIVHYLKRKELGLPLPAAVIPELDVFQAEPWSLPGGLKKENRYFFSRLKGGYAFDANKSRRIAGSGYWKATRRTRLVQASKTSNQVVGVRRTLVFSQGKKHAAVTTAQWVMHEFHLLGLSQLMESGDRWVIYRLHQRKRKPRREALISQEKPESSNDAGPPYPSSSSSSSRCPSGVTEVSSNGELEQDEVSSFR